MNKNRGNYTVSFDTNLSERAQNLKKKQNEAENITLMWQVTMADLKEYKALRIKWKRKVVSWDDA